MFWLIYDTTDWVLMIWMPWWWFIKTSPTMHRQIANLLKNVSLSFFVKKKITWWTWERILRRRLIWGRVKKLCDFMFIHVGNPFLIIYLLPPSFINHWFFSISRDLAMFLKKIVIMFGPMNLWSMIYIIVGFWTFADQFFGDALIG